jgi:hypothetical protein
MIKDLIKIAGQLDAAGFTSEANQVDKIIRKIARKSAWVRESLPFKGSTLKDAVEQHMANHGGVSMKEVVDYNVRHNEGKNKSFDPNNAKEFWIFCDGSCGD